ncbi:COG4705 family protein [Pantoea sp. C2G6]|uniref:COG4705 family protein n=1 Tax=Pantoea sp. C2G6 TaxID=3243084 RepID=UPI003ED8D0C0
MQIKTTDSSTLSKVPAVTAAFWLTKIAATTLGETGGDAVTMSMNLGYLTGTLIFALIFLVAVVAQIKSQNFNKWLYWLTVVATTTVGTTLADFADRSLGIGYPGGVMLLSTLLVLSLFIWHITCGTIAVTSVNNEVSESFYWVTIMFSQTLGTALGDWTADSEGLGYAGGILLFVGVLTMIWAASRFTSLSRTALFWAAFILTRPLGAVVGDFLDKPIADGGMALSRYSASLVLALIIIAFLWLLPQRPAAKVAATQ